jgi:hypothetical protein
MNESSALVSKSVPVPVPVPVPVLIFNLLIALSTTKHEIFTLCVANIPTSALIIRVEKGMICGKLYMSSMRIWVVSFCGQ